MNISLVAERPSSAGVSSHYDILRRLGEGGCGQVFEAWDRQLCRNVALKRLKVPARAGPGASLLAEARIAAALKHPAFVQVFAIDGDPAAPAIVMELVAGCTLSQRLQEQTMAPADALDIAAQVAAAMAAAHAARLAHGDLKPSNLMLEPAGRVRILDFGLAREVDPLATQSVAPDATQGTVAYMAPERLRGQPADVGGDIYALGLILYEMLAGQRPFADLHGLALAAAHLQSSSAAWTYPAAWDPALVGLIRAMTEHDPARRLRSMQQVVERIAALRNGGAPPPARRPFRRARARLPALLLVGSAILCGAWLALGGHGLPLPYSEAAALRAGMDALSAPHGAAGLETAIGQFTRILEQQPRHAGAAAGLSLAYSMRYAGDGRDEAWLQRADASAQAALRADDQLSLAYAAQAWVRDNQGRLSEALRLAEQALRFDPRSQFGLRIRALLLIRSHRFDEAERAIGDAMRIYPADPWFSDCMGKLRYQQGRYAEAEQAFRRSLRSDPDSIFAYVNLSQALLGQNRGDTALQVLQQGLLVRHDSRLYGSLGTILFERGDYGGAAQAFERAVSSGKGSPNLYLNWANLADALRWLPGRAAASRDAYRQAASLLAPLLRRAPDDSTLQSRMGLYSAKLDARGPAEQWTALALRAAPSSAQVRFRAAVAYELLGRRGAALAELAQARARGYPPNLIDTEPDLLALRRDPRYHDFNPESTQ